MPKSTGDKRPTSPGLPKNSRILVAGSKQLATSLGTTQKSIKINELAQKRPRLGTTPDLFHVEKQIEFQDVEMGVLESGVPYLTSRGLAKMIGIDHGPFHRLTTNWVEESSRPRGRAIQKLLEEHEYFEDSLYLRAEYRGVEVNSFTEPVCLALLEYYAFVADERREKALSAFRSLARLKFREFVYDAVGYRPEQKILDSWQHFHDRVDLTQDAAPVGFFGVFSEIAFLIVPMIRSGVMISDKVVPDISVGRYWSEYWQDNNLDQAFGPRTKYDLEYPSYYPQATKAWPSYAYPNSALGEFRDWIRKNYLSLYFPTYLFNQATKGKLTRAVALQTTKAFGLPAIDFNPAPKATRSRRADRLPPPSNLQ